MDRINEITLSCVVSEENLVLFIAADVDGCCMEPYVCVDLPV